MKIVVAPLAGARIEIAHPPAPFPAPHVAPLAGARIEICQTVLVLLQPPSLPSRERGLKFRMNDNDIMEAQVAPLAGARIEIQMTVKEALDAAVAPLAGARIEICFVR